MLVNIFDRRMVHENDNKIQYIMHCFAEALSRFLTESLIMFDRAKSELNIYLSLTKGTQLLDKKAWKILCC